MYEALEAEQSLISCLIQRQEAIEEVVDMVSPEMFDVACLGGIYYEYRKAFDDRKSITLVELKENLKIQFTEEEIAEAIRTCLASDGLPYQIRNYAEVVARHFKKTMVESIFSRTELQDATIETQIDNIIGDLEMLRGGKESEGFTIAELAEKYENDYFTDKEKNILFLGIDQIDGLTGGWQGGDVVYLGARPSTGKSALAMEWAEIIAKQGKTVYFYNLEMQNEAVFERAIAAKSGIEITRIRRATTFHNDEKELYMNAIAELKSQTGIRIITGPRRISEIRNDVRKNRPDLVVIDYIQLIICEDRYKGNRVMEVGQISHDIKSVATSYNIPVLCLCQLSRLVDGRKDHKPILSDLRESGDLEQDGSIVYFLYNNNEEDRSEKVLSVAKSRQGMLGDVPMRFNGAKMHFELEENISPFGA